MSKKFHISPEQRRLLKERLIEKITARKLGNLSAIKTIRWRAIETAPKDGTKIVAWCVHNADQYFEEDGKSLTVYGAHTEGLSHVDDGLNIVVWGGELDERTYEEPCAAFIPDWWFEARSDFQVVANPTHWLPLIDVPR